MKILELHFNPGLEKTKIYNTACFRSQKTSKEAPKELCIIVELRTYIYKRKYRSFLKKLSKIIKKEYYQVSQESSQEKFKKALEMANEFIVSGRKKIKYFKTLNAVILAISNNTYLNLAQIGNFSSFFLRNNQVMDISSSLEENDSEKEIELFHNITVGALMPKDKIIILSQEVARAFQEKEIFNSLASNNQKTKKILRNNRKFFKSLSGVGLLIETPSNLLRKSILPSLPSIPKISFPHFSHHFSFPHFVKLNNFFRERLSEKKLKKNLIYLLILFILLLLGYLFFK